MRNQSLPRQKNEEAAAGLSGNEGIDFPPLTCPVTSCRIKGGGSSNEGSAKQFSDDVLNHFAIECREQSGELYVSGVTSGGSKNAANTPSRLVTACRWHGRRSGRLPRSCRTGIRCSCRVSHDGSSSIVAALTDKLGTLCVTDELPLRRAGSSRGSSSIAAACVTLALVG
jgi:hypothetical protein